MNTEAPQRFPLSCCQIEQRFPKCCSVSYFCSSELRALHTQVGRSHLVEQYKLCKASTHTLTTKVVSSNDSHQQALISFLSHLSTDHQNYSIKLIRLHVMQEELLRRDEPAENYHPAQQISFISTELSFLVCFSLTTFLKAFAASSCCTTQIKPAAR